MIGTTIRYSGYVVRFQEWLTSHVQEGSIAIAALTLSRSSAQHIDSNCLASLVFVGFSLLWRYVLRCLGQSYLPKLGQ
jgi:hypothetical protein